MGFFEVKRFKVNRRRICIVITARPSYSRIKTVLKNIQAHEKLNLQLVVSGSALLDRYGMAVDYIEGDGFKITEKVFNVLEGDSPISMAKTTGLSIMDLSSVFHNLKPHAVVTIADRFETIATSISASYQNIPLVHIQGGEVTGNIDEKVRHANTKLADIHFVASKSAYNRVIKLGEDPEFVFKTGCPSIDLAKEVALNPYLDFDPIKKYGGVGKISGWKSKYMIVMHHPVTTEYKQAKDQILQILEAVTELGIPTFWFWPNIDVGSDSTSKGIRSFREENKLDNIRFFKNMEPVDFLKLLINSNGLIGNSSVGIRESSFFGLPVVNIGTRQEGRERANNVIDCKNDRQSIKEAIKICLSIKERDSSYIYGDGNSGEKIADLLAEIPLRYHKKITY